MRSAAQIAASTSEEASLRPRSTSDRYGTETFAALDTSASVRPCARRVRRSTSPIIVRKQSGYSPGDCYDSDAELKAAIDAIASGRFSPEDPSLFQPVIASLLGDDEYMVLADYRSYLDCHDQAGLAWADQDQWTRMSILNTARSGFFSSDRTVRSYCHDIWQAEPVPVPSGEEAGPRPPSPGF